MSSIVSGQASVDRARSKRDLDGSEHSPATGNDSSQREAPARILERVARLSTRQSESLCSERVECLTAHADLKPASAFSFAR